MVNLKDIELLYNSIPTACIILKPDNPRYTIAAANNTFLSATYTKRSAIIDRPFFEAFPANKDDDGSRTENITSAFDHVLQYKMPHLVAQHRYDLPASFEDDEHARYWNIETYPLLNENGNVEYIVQSSTDVTALVEAEQKVEEHNARLLKELEERKKIELALQLSNERFTYVNKATNDAIYDWNLEVDKIQWGVAFFSLLGYPEEENFSIDKWTSLVHTEDLPALARSLYDTLNDRQKSNWKAAYRIKKLDGTYADVEENGYILRDEHGLARRMIGVLRDVSDRKIAEAELESLKVTYTDLFQLSPLPKWVYDFDSLMFLDVNEAAVAHYGYTKEEFLTMSIRDIRPKEDEELFLSSIRNEVKPGISHTTEVRHVKKSGEVILVSTRGNSIRYGTKQARIVVAIDITEKTRSEKALIDSERRFKALIQEGSDLIAILDSEGVYKYVSPTAERLLDIHPQELIGENVFDFIHENDREELLSRFQSLDNSKRIKLAPFRYLDANAGIHWMETIVTDMRDDDAIGGIVCNSRVVTERVEHELKIKEHLDRFNAVSKATSDSIWDLDFVKDRVLWNHGIQVVFGYNEREVNYKWWYDRVHPEDLKKVTQIVEDSIRNKVPRWISEYRFRCADETYKHVLDRGILIFDEQTGKPLRMIGAIQDISERVAHTRAVEEHNARLKEIAWTQAHLVRAPLTSILGLMPLLNDPKADDCARQAMLLHLNTAAMQLDDVIKAIISKSREAEKIPHSL